MLIWYFASITIIGLLFNNGLRVQGIPVGSKVAKTNQLAVFGHMKPDTDTIATAIAFAKFLNLKNINAKPYRLGELNKETQFVLNYTGVEQPDLLPNDMPDGSKVALIDHNESKRMHAYSSKKILANCEILEISKESVVKVTSQSLSLRDYN